MAEKIKSATAHNGFMIQEVTLESVGGVAGGSSSPHSYTQWRIVAIDGKADNFVTAMSREDAERKIDSGEAKKQMMAKR